MLRKGVTIERLDTRIYLVCGKCGYRGIDKSVWARGPWRLPGAPGACRLLAGLNKLRFEPTGYMRSVTRCPSDPR